MTCNLVLIGSGKWGKNYINTLSHSYFDIVSLKVANRENWKELINNKPDGVIIATPPQSHIEIASYALERNIPVMIEKPLALSLKECKVLEQYTAPILINHIHLFSNRYQWLKELIVSDFISNIYTVNLGNSLPRDYSELWDYAPHDIAMILDLCQQFPKSIKCNIDSKSNRCFNIKMQFKNTNFNCDFESTSKIGVLDNTKNGYLIINNNDLYKYEFKDRLYQDFPLTNALNVFIDAIDGQSDYRVGLDLSLKVMKVLEICNEQLI